MKDNVVEYKQTPKLTPYKTESVKNIFKCNTFADLAKLKEIPVKENDAS